MDGKTLSMKTHPNKTALTVFVTDLTGITQLYMLLRSPTSVSAEYQQVLHAWTNLFFID